MADLTSFCPLPPKVVEAVQVLADEARARGLNVADQHLTVILAQFALISHAVHGGRSFR